MGRSPDGSLDSQADNQGELMLQWQMVTGGQAVEIASADLPVFQAWNRCLALGVNPRRPNAVFLEGTRLEEKVAARRLLIAKAHPHLKQISLALNHWPHVAILSNEGGWILTILGTPDTFGGRRTAVAIGANWSERYLGNNCIGTTLHTGKPVVVFGVEHYNRSFHGVTGIGIPIEVDGRVVGALGVMIPNDHAHPAILHLAQACVNSIQQSLELDARQIEGEPPTEKADLAQHSSVMPQQELLRGVVHDLKNPLAAMRAMAQLGIRLSESPRVNDLLEKIVDQTDKLTEMVRELLNPTDMASPVVMSPVEIIRSALSDISTLCARQGVFTRLEVLTPQKALIQVGLLRRAINNILINAIRVMPGGGGIDVVLREEAGSIMIAITDTGPGIPREIRGRVFEPFTTTHDDGTGLGLYITKQFITQGHGGDIWFETETGKGTTFFIQIPAAEGD